MLFLLQSGLRGRLIGVRLSSHCQLMHPLLSSLGRRVVAVVLGGFPVRFFRQMLDQFVIDPYPRSQRKRCPIHVPGIKR